MVIGLWTVLFLKSDSETSHTTGKNVWPSISEELLLLLLLLVLEGGGGGRALLPAADGFALFSFFSFFSFFCFGFFFGCGCTDSTTSRHSLSAAGQRECGRSEWMCAMERISKKTCGVQPQICKKRLLGNIRKGWRKGRQRETYPILTRRASN